jgi:beta-catenin-like protein 1
LAKTIVQNTSILEWLLTRIQAKAYDSNKQYASEILAILLQTTPENHAALNKLNGTEVLLKCLAPFRKRDPGTPDEQEVMENLFDAVCSALGDAQNRIVFLKEEGVELMTLMLKYVMIGKL